MENHANRTEFPSESKTGESQPTFFPAAPRMRQHLIKTDFSNETMRMKEKRKSRIHGQIPMPVTLWSGQNEQNKTPSIRTKCSHEKLLNKSIE